MIPIVQYPYRKQIKEKTSHILITGTGRCGTTFLMQILSLCKLDTGFQNMDIPKHGDECKDHLEPYFTWGSIKRKTKKSVISKFAPIFKAPQANIYIPDMLRYINLDHVIIPMRNLKDTVYSAEKRGIKDGGFGHYSKDEYTDNLLRSTYKLFDDLTQNNIDYTTIAFPKLTKDCEYLYDKLLPIFPQLDKTIFNESFEYLTT